jgi:hypothetical protein
LPPADRAGAVFVSDAIATLRRVQYWAGIYSGQQDRANPLFSSRKAAMRDLEHRIREMTKEDIRQVGETGPTIDSIEVAEFESHDALKQWLSEKASAFLP